MESVSPRLVLIAIVSQKYTDYRKRANRYNRDYFQTCKGRVAKRKGQMAANERGYSIEVRKRRRENGQCVTCGRKIPDGAGTASGRTCVLCIEGAAINKTMRRNFF